MKKWRYHILPAMMLLWLLFPLNAAGEIKDSVRITASGGKADIALRLPEGKYEKITSLRLKLVVAEESGSIAMDKDKVVLNGGNIHSKIQEVFVDRVSAQDLGNESGQLEDKNGEVYLVDILLSGETDIFQAQTEEETYVDICSLTVSPQDERKDTRAAVTVYDNTYEIVNSVGRQSVIQVPQVSGIVEIPGKSTDEGMVIPPPDTETPEPTQAPTPTPAPVSGTEEATPTPVAVTTEIPLPAVSPTPAADPFNRKKAGVLKGKGKNGTKKVTLTWEPVKGAKGYQLQVYNRTAKRYKVLKTIKDPKASSFTTKNLQYGLKYRFRMRAFTYGENGKRIYGKYSKVIAVKTAPGAAAIKDLSSPQKGMVSLTWKKPRGAVGYQIYQSDQKNGKYRRVKTITKGNTTSCTLTGRDSKKTYFFKIRAFVKESNGKKTYGKFGSVKSLTVR